jgi:hypothetical protein
MEIHEAPRAQIVYLHRTADPGVARLCLDAAPRLFLPHSSVRNMLCDGQNSVASVTRECWGVVQAILRSTPDARG